MRRAAKRDLTEPSIIKALEDAGCQVIQLDKFDLLVMRFGRGFSHAPMLFMIDCKSPGGRPTLSQKRLVAEGWPLYYAETPEAALEIVGL